MPKSSQTIPTSETAKTLLRNSSVKEKVNKTMAKLERKISGERNMREKRPANERWFNISRTSAAARAITTVDRTGFAPRISAALLRFVFIEDLRAAFGMIRLYPFPKMFSINSEIN
ncbi:MAG: hypothetical protein K6F67_06200 [Oscillospiraceae bacterium]|nr:hypothetical protein [Oscillospiraceae bacterium]